MRCVFIIQPLCHSVRITYCAGIKPRDAAAVLCGLSSPMTFTTRDNARWRCGRVLRQRAASHVDVRRRALTHVDAVRKSHVIWWVSVILRPNGCSMMHYSGPTRFLRFVRTAPHVDARICECSHWLRWVCIARQRAAGNARSVSECVLVFLCVRTAIGGRISRKRLEIEVRLQWDTNRKWHVADRLVIWPMTLVT